MTEYTPKDFEGTCQSFITIAEKLGIPEDDVDDVMLDENLEVCGVCRWWMEVCELEYCEEREFGVCQSCDPEMHET